MDSNNIKTVNGFTLSELDTFCKENFENKNLISAFRLVRIKSPRSWQVLHYRYICNFTYEEISKKIFNINTGKEGVSRERVRQMLITALTYFSHPKIMRVAQGK